MATKRRTAKSAAGGKPRKMYPAGIGRGGVFAHPNRQPAETRSYVKSHWDDKKSGIGIKGYANKNRSMLSSEYARKGSGNYVGHKMTKATGRLKKGWGRSEKGSGVKSQTMHYAMQGMSSAAAKRRARQNHVVKFGPDPYHN